MVTSDIEYKGYVAKIDYDSRDNIFVGRVTNVDDIISFHNESAFKMQKTFEETIDGYLENCKELGVDPANPR